ncbi:MAG TPA: NAD(P)/FAD-dependent oxidoreductase [Polyangiales bacterium]|nr:NAD(P)/FAD-dependent oxidoreductase [Polyangiales bacterium]
MPSIDFDCIIVGARCAGASLALRLARAGMRTLVLESAALHSDQPFSTHVIQTVGMDLLDELGIGERVRAVTPAVRTARLSVRGHAFDMPLHAPRYMYAPRRSTLDPMLQDAALAAGVEIRDKTRVTELIVEHGTVCGVVAEHGEHAQRYRARWVIGADGRNSTVARLLGARTYIEHVSDRGGYWAYWEKPRCWDEADPWRRFQTVIDLDATGRFAFETDSGLLVIGAIPARDVARGWHGAYASELHRSLRASPLTAPLVEAEPIATPVGLLKAHFFFKQPVGPGWALVGDAGLHKDPTPGHGITDALRDAASLARALLDGRPEALEVYWRKRDVESVPLYYQALDLGRLSYVNSWNELVLDRLNTGGESAHARMREVFDRTRSPFDGIAPRTMLRWFGSELLKRRSELVRPFWASVKLGAMVQRELANRTRRLKQAEAAAAERSRRMA